MASRTARETFSGCILSREAKFQADFLRNLRAGIADLNAVVMKHNDQFFKGCPDVSVTVGDSNHTLWLELKVQQFLKRQTEINFKKIIRDSPVQFPFCRNLGALYIVKVHRTPQITLWNPRTESVIVTVNTIPEMVREVRERLKELIRRCS